ncbi:MAG TPA: hypothetical protein EYG73_05315 [Arcobacter sp.]|nr:hypothetical protein [Arcobacter sp.]
MSNQNNQLILKEGFVPVVIALAISLFLNIVISDALGNIGFVVTLALIFIYRNPSRATTNNKDMILAPIDGKISAIDISKNKYKIYIDVNLCDTHVLRAPIKSKFKTKSFKNGLNLKSTSYKARLLNTQAVIKFDDIKVKLISGICNSDIVLYENEKVEATQSIGVFLNGLVIVELPRSCNIKVELNDKVYAGLTQIA